MSNPVLQNRYGSKFKVSYPDFPTFDITPQSITITQNIGHQDVVEIVYPRFSSFYMKALRTGVPVQIQLSNDKAKETWVGYVLDAGKNTTSSLNVPVIVRCIGSSLSLKEGGSKIWINKTAPDIVAEIAKQFKLKPVVTPHKMIFSQQSMTGHTYWEKIQELASKIGYVAHMVGTELHFHPLDIMIDKFMTTIPTMSYIEDSMPPNSRVYDQTLDVFKAKFSDYSDMDMSTKRLKNVYGIDPVTAKFYSADSSSNSVGKNLKEDVRNPLFSEMLSTEISGSKEMAQILADAYAQFSRFVHHGHGSGQGDPRIAPHRTLELKGTGEDTDGFWVVKKAIHFITFDGRYTVEFWCHNDGRGKNKISVTRPSEAGSVPVRNIKEELATGGPSAPTSSRISAPASLIRQTDAGFSTTPRRWVGV